MGCACSCDYNDWDMPTIYRENMQRARKEHKCSECGESIMPGDTYRYIFGVWDDKPDTFHQCLPCVRVWEHYGSMGCCPYLGGLWETVSEIIEADESRAIRELSDEARKELEELDLDDDGKYLY